MSDDTESPEAPQALAVSDTTAVAKADPMPWNPRDPSEGYRLAKWLSMSELVPGALRNKPYSILHVIMAGRDMGLSAMQSIERLHVIDGKIGVAWQEMIRRVLESPLCEYFLLHEYEDAGELSYATYVTRRRGWPEGVTQQCCWNVERAKQAGLWDKGSSEEKRAKNNWHRMPLTMCKRRAAVELARDVYPDVLGGAYDPEELAEVEPVAEPLPSPPPPGLKERLKARAEADAMPAWAEVPETEIDPDTGEVVPPPRAA